MGDDKKKFSLSGRSQQERGVTFSVRENPTLGMAQKVKKTKASPAWRNMMNKHKVQLGTWEATAICGNDITSSCLYVAAISATYAGAYAPISLLMVAGVLFLYRNVYAEVGDALPLNGGAYNCLLNTTTKAKASIAACMTLLSYIATAVISAKTSVEYLARIGPEFNTINATIIVLALFAGLTIIGIGESAKAALAIFIFHLIALTVLIVAGSIVVIQDPSTLVSNWNLPSEDSVFKSLFFGFSVALLGVSGFESSANFIEEQKPGVFPKTLRNMWLAVTILNPTIAIIALGVLPLDGIVAANKALLVDVAEISSGTVLSHIIAIDAVFVLFGAVLAGFIGSTGLVGRMTLDRCLPQFLLKVNRRGTSHRIIFLFFFLCVSILLITKGDVYMLGGIYTISFLGVMSLFACGNILLKVRRAKLPRKIHASWLAVLVALLCTLAGIYGNILIDPQNLQYFSYYFFPAVGIVLFTLYRHHIYNLVLIIFGETMKSLEHQHHRIREKIARKLVEIKSEGIIFFTKGDDVSSLNKAMLYVQNNEITNKITVVHILDGMESPPPRLVSDLKLLDEIYPEMDIELVVRSGKFGPGLIEDLSEEYSVPPNYMFVGTPGDHFPHRISDLGGVRVII